MQVDDWLDSDEWLAPFSEVPIGASVRVRGVLFPYRNKSWINQLGPGPGVEEPGFTPVPVDLSRVTVSHDQAQVRCDFHGIWMGVDGLLCSRVGIADDMRRKPLPAGGLPASVDQEVTASMMLLWMSSGCGWRGLGLLKGR